MSGAPFHKERIVQPKQLEPIMFSFRTAFLLPCFTAVKDFPPVWLLQYVE